MLTSSIRSQIAASWNAFWAGGISNPLEDVKQIACLLFLKCLDNLHTLEENKARILKLKKMERRVFPEGKDPKPPIFLLREFVRRVTVVKSLKKTNCISLAEIDALLATLQLRTFRRGL